MSKKLWTHEEEQTLRKCAEEGFTRKETAHVLNRSIASMRQKASQMGVEFERAQINPEAKREVISLALKGKTYGEIAMATGLSRGTVGGHIDRWERDGKPPLRDKPSISLPLTQTPRKAYQAYSQELEDEIRHREADRRFWRALAKAFQRGDHLPKGSVRELKLIG